MLRASPAMLRRCGHCIGGNTGPLRLSSIRSWTLATGIAAAFAAPSNAITQADIRITSLITLQVLPCSRSGYRRCHRCRRRRRCLHSGGPMDHAYQNNPYPLLTLRASLELSAINTCGHTGQIAAIESAALAARYGHRHRSHRRHRCHHTGGVIRQLASPPQPSPTLMSPYMPTCGVIRNTCLITVFWSFAYATGITGTAIANVTRLHGWNSWSTAIIEYLILDSSYWHRRTN